MESAAKGPGAPWVASAFCELAEALRMQFEWHMAMRGGGLERVGGAGGGYREATSDRIFPQSAVWAFLEDLRELGRSRIGVRHASSPQLRLFVGGCGRPLGAEESPATWHYVYSLTRWDQPPVRVMVVSEVDIETSPGVTRGREFQLGFNQLLLHPAGSPISIGSVHTQADWYSGALLLEGWLW